MSLSSRRVVLLLTLLASEGVAAAEPADDARRLVAEATVAYNLGHFEEAVSRYEECYRLLGDPVLLFNLGQTYRLDGKPEQALRAYRSFLRTAPPDAPARAVAERHAAALTQGLAGETARPLVPAWRPPATRAPGLELTRGPAAAPPRFYARWWFWTAAGAALVGGAALGFALHDRHEGPISGSIEPGVVAVR